MLRKFRKLNLSIVKVRAKLVHVIFHYFVICKTASHYNISLLQSEHIFRPVQYSLFRNTIGNPFNFNVSILQYCKFNVSEQSQCNCVVTSSVSQYFNIASYPIFQYSFLSNISIFHRSQIIHSDSIWLLIWASQESHWVPSCSASSHVYTKVASAID